MIGYHFTGERLRDGRPIPAIGKKLVHDGALVICESGLHGSDDPFDALKYAPGAMLHRVEYGGEVIRQHDKWCARERTILATIDATHLLRRFAADQALSVAHLWDMPYAVRDYLTSLDEGKRATALATAWAAARATARATAWDAARAAAWDAARDAAWDAARAAAWDGAWDAARAAARAAAWDGAWDAARDAAWADFSARVEAAFAAQEKQA